MKIPVRGDVPCFCGDAKFLDANETYRSYGIVPRLHTVSLCEPLPTALRGHRSPGVDGEFFLGAKCIGIVFARRSGEGGLLVRPDDAERARAVLAADEARVLPQTKIKRDDGKVDFTYLPFDSLEEVVDVLAWAAEGANAKYARESWRALLPDPVKGPPDLRSVRSALRHIIADVRGQPHDPETGLRHLAHAACQILFAIAHRRANPNDIRRVLPEEVKPL